MIQHQLYLNPEYDKYDVPKAVDFLLKASKSGHSQAQYLLGKLLLTGEVVCFCMDIAALQAAIQSDIKNNRKPFVVIASAGTTNTGSIDPMAEIAVLCRKYDMWMHVDGAFGASVLLSERYREKLSGIELSDSLSMDAHKWLLQTYGCSVVLVRNRSVLVQSFAAHPEYLKDAEST